MLYEITNGDLSITADTFGAELHSLKLGGLEYLWQCGDAWKRYAPILFPFICSPEGGVYKADGKTYRMKANHGFARDKEFVLLEKDDTSVTFQLCADAETLAQYPYDFVFAVKYTVLEDGVRVEHFVRNTGEKPMYFYIGGHPAFNCPLEAGEAFTDYYVEYEKNEHLTRRIDGVDVTLVEDGNNVPVTRELFNHDAIILPTPNSKQVSLRSHKSAHSVTVEFPESGCIAVWSPEKNDAAAFVCLEPWTSVPVYYDEDEEIEKKAHAIRLEPDKEHSYAYTIRVK